MYLNFSLQEDVDVLAYCFPVCLLVAFFAAEGGAWGRAFGFDEALRVKY